MFARRRLIPLLRPAAPRSVRQDDYAGNCAALCQVLWSAVSGVSVIGSMHDLTTPLMSSGSSRSICTDPSPDYGT